MVTETTGGGAQVEVAGSDSVPSARISGELDLVSADTVRQALLGAVTDAVEGFEVDLADLDFLDSSGLTVFVELADRVPVRIVAASEPARRAITVTGLDEHFGLLP